MWKKIKNFKEIKKVPVGTKIRINGEENILQFHYDPDDYGFDTNLHTIPNNIVKGGSLDIEYWVDEDIWHPWPGGECPVEPFTDVEVLFYDGRRARTTSSHNIDWDDIVAYRVVESERDRVIKEAKKVCGCYLNLEEALGKLYDSGMLK